MNDLQYAGTHNGNVVLYFPIAGHEFWFEKINHREVRLMRVTVVDSVEQIWDKETTLENLPTKARAVLQQNNLRFRSRVTNAEEAMA